MLASPTLLLKENEEFTCKKIRKGQDHSEKGSIKVTLCLLIAIHL